jgi:hypothetical protein
MDNRLSSVDDVAGVRGTMSQNIPDSAAILADHVDAAAESVRHVRKARSMHDQQIRYVRDLLATAGGDEVESAGCDASVHFDAWRSETSRYSSTGRRRDDAIGAH